MYILVVAELGYYAIIISMASILKGYSHHKMLRHIAKIIHNYVHIVGGLTSGNSTDLESAGSKDPSAFLLHSGATRYSLCKVLQHSPIQVNWSVLSHVV